ncbi:MAG TPA: hypothetical protein VG204_05465 [Terriglobia bacterium]|nr:hypothetical protein [Terriglobia bacterium]
MQTQTQQVLEQHHDLGRQNGGGSSTLAHQRGNWDHATFLWSVGNDVDFFIELVRKFLISYPHSLASIDSSLRDNVGNLPVVEAGARGLRESLQDLAAKPASDIATKLETAARAGDLAAAQAAFRLLQDEISDLTPAFDRIGEQLVRSEF